MFNIIKQFMAYRRQIAEDRVMYQRFARLTAIEMRTYTIEQCLIAVSKINNIRAVDVGPLAKLMHTRCGRGKATINDAIALVVA